MRLHRLSPKTFDLATAGEEAVDSAWASLDALMGGGELDGELDGELEPVPVD